MNFKVTFILAVVFIMALVNVTKAWEIDFSRRQKRAPASEQASVPAADVPTELPAKKSTTPAATSARLDEFVSRVKGTAPVDRQELVILNTAKGFVPKQVRVHKGVHYVVHVVNVNEDKKNVSYMLDAFNQHHSTYYGKIKSFYLDPDKEGVFDFQCPETSAEGKLIVFGNGPSPVVPNSAKEQRHVTSEP